MRRLTLVILLALTGCASRPLEADGGAPVPVSSIFERRYAGAATAEGDGTVRFLRDWGFGGGGCAHEVRIDQVKVFSIGVRERIEIHLPAGPHFIQMQNASFLCPSVSVSQETTVKAGGVQVFRIQVPATGGLSLSRIQ